MFKSVRAAIIPGAVICAFALGFALHGRLSERDPESKEASHSCPEHQSDKDEKDDKEKKGPVAVETASLRDGSLPVLLPCTGQIELKPESAQTLSPRTAAIVTQVLHRDGDSVQKGDV